MSRSGERRNPFFRLVVIASALFIVTVLALVASMFSDPNSPLPLLLNAHAGQLIGWEVGSIVFLGLAALSVDRWQTLRDSPGRSDDSPHEAGAAERERP